MLQGHSSRFPSPNGSIMNWKLNSNLTAMSIVAACLILAGGTVVGAYHSYKMLGWIAVFPVAGFLFADYLGFHLIFFARKEKGLLGWSSLVCKFLIFGTLLLNGASLVYLLITESKDRAATASKIETEKSRIEIETAAKMKLIEAESAAHRAEETQRAENAAKLAIATGNARLARVVTTTRPAQPITFDVAATPSPTPEPTEENKAKDDPSTFERFISWYVRAPLYFSGGLVALACFILTQVFGKLAADRTACAATEWPDEIDANARSERNQSRFDGEASHARNIASHESGEASQDGLRILQETCSQISFGLPGRWFAVDVRPDHVRVRLRTRVDGREATLKTARLTLEVLRDALTMQRDQFRSRVERSLKRGGFEL
jgi:hypothetical protein